MNLLSKCQLSPIYKLFRKIYANTLYNVVIDNFKTIWYSSLKKTFANFPEDDQKKIPRRGERKKF